MRVVVTGRAGQLVTALAATAGPDVEIVPLGRPGLDLTCARGIRSALEMAAPDIIVSAAAYTAVDRAESEPAIADLVNAVAPGEIGRAARMLGVPVVHISTDYVFSGDKPCPYLETDATGPRTAYGRSKLAGEQALAATTGDFAILRTAWLYSPFGSNFVKTMLRLAGEHRQVRVVADQYGSPTSALDLADAVIAVARRMLEFRDDPGLRGVFHLAGRGEANWAEFADAVFAASAAYGGPRACVVPIGTADYPTPARRPTNSRLDTGKLQAAYGLTLPDWHESVDRVVRALM